VSLAVQGSYKLFGEVKIEAQEGIWALEQSQICIDLMRDMRVSECKEPTKIPGLQIRLRIAEESLLNLPVARQQRGINGGCAWTGRSETLRPPDRKSGWRTGRASEEAQTSLHALPS